jgi:general secretion pathway protein G
MRTPTHANAENAPRLESSRGFTLIELLVVCAIILVLASIAAGRYSSAVVRSHEAVLHQDLTVMRNAIQQYTLDKEAAPQSLDDLKDYIREVPIDPITNQKDWTTDTCDVALSPEQTTFGICEVHSGSDKVSPFESTPYSSW